jgi:trans-2-enoyl-CoA reductase
MGLNQLLNYHNQTTVSINSVTPILILITSANIINITYGEVAFTIGNSFEKPINHTKQTKRP